MWVIADCVLSSKRWCMWVRVIGDVHVLSFVVDSIALSLLFCHWDKSATFWGSPLRDGRSNVVVIVLLSCMLWMCRRLCGRRWSMCMHRGLWRRGWEWSKYRGLWERGKGSEWTMRIKVFVPFRFASMVCHWVENLRYVLVICSAALINGTEPFLMRRMPPVWKHSLANFIPRLLPWMQSITASIKSSPCTKFHICSAWHDNADDCIDVGLVTKVYPMRSLCKIKVTSVHDYILSTKEAFFCFFNNSLSRSKSVLIVGDPLFSHCRGQTLHEFLHKCCLSTTRQAAKDDKDHCRKRTIPKILECFTITVHSSKRSLRAVPKLIDWEVVPYMAFISLL